MDKNSLRQEYISKRNVLSWETVFAKSRKVFENFKDCGFEKTVQKVLVYLPIKNEVETKLIIEYLRQNKKNIFLPTFIEEGWIISEFINKEDLVDGPFGTRQPAKSNVASVSDLDLTIVPGLAFSKNGFRLGYGKGVYDKLLKNFCGIKVGLAYDFQIVNEFSHQKHDVKMDYLITEKRIIRIT